MGIEEGGLVIVTGFTIRFQNGRFRLFIGANSLFEMVPSDQEDATVPSNNNPEPKSIEEAIDMVEYMMPNEERIFDLEVLLTEMDLRGSVYGTCGGCSTWQRIEKWKCRTCESTLFSKSKFDIKMSIADGTGQWTGLRLKDPYASQVLNATITEENFDEETNRWILEWVKATISLTKGGSATQVKVINMIIN